MSIPPEGIALSESSPWAPWTPWQVAERLRDVDARWYVVAGWAVDLAVGRVTRPHEDIEIGVPRADFPQVRHALDDLEALVVGDGRGWPLDSPAFEQHFQTWFRDPASGVFHLDVFRDPHDGDDWLCRRDETIRRHFTDVIRTTEDGVPYLAPECVLLFKAKHRRPKDDADLEMLLPVLDAAERGWLVDALTRIHPGHEWILRISAGGR